MSSKHEFEMVILGRIIEHLGSMMYKHRSPSIAELVANCWDAGAKEVWVTVPTKENYSQDKSKIVVMDSGEGMDAGAIQDCYLVIGRNRRQEQGVENLGRKVMGRKGIGKLAGFGLAEHVRVITWQKNSPATQFDMPLDRLKEPKAGEHKKIKFYGVDVVKKEDWPESGTIIELSQLRHSSPIDVDSLTVTLSRRFSRIVRGEMKIMINNNELAEPSLEVICSEPAGDGFLDAKLESGQMVKYRYHYSSKPISSKEMQGFTIQANGRTAQAPPFFFNVETTASSQHSTRYLTGEIIADFIDDGCDDRQDSISTDRQNLDWEKEELAELKKWGDELTRKLLIDCAKKHGKELENKILTDPDFQLRIARLEPASQKEISGFLKTLGQKHSDNDERTRSLADSLIRAYEFHVFHNVIGDIQKVGDDPERLEEILDRLREWKVLESRAILEIVKGRLSIVKKLEQMIINNAPETASKNTYDNLHDLLAEYPWLFDPEWQVFTEEKSVSKQLKEWGVEDCSEDIKDGRVDFLAFGKDDELIVIEIKRPGYAVTFKEIQRIEGYQERLRAAHPNSRRVLVYGGKLDVSPAQAEIYRSASGKPGALELIEWHQMFARANRYYAHYEAVLKGDVQDPNFASKANEVIRTQQVLETTSHRSKKDRKRGLGNADP